MGDIRVHPQTVRVKECVLAAVKPDERDRVRLSEPARRQMEGRLVVENFDLLCVSKLLETLHCRSIVFCRVYGRLLSVGRPSLARAQNIFLCALGHFFSRCSVCSFVHLVSSL